MNKQEYENLTRTHISDSNYYNIVEPMYMAMKVNKRQFVALLDPKEFAEPVDTPKEMLIKVNIPVKQLNGVVKGGVIGFKQLFAKVLDSDIETGKAFIEFLDKEAQETLRKQFDNFSYSLNIPTIALNKCFDRYWYSAKDSDELLEQFNEITGQNLDSYEWGWIAK